MGKNAELNCKEGKTKFFMDNIPCELMEYMRSKAQKNIRSITGEILLLIKKDKEEHEKESK